MRKLFALVAPLLLASCSASSVASCRPLPTSAPLRLLFGPITLSATRASVAPGQSDTLTVTIHGPVQFSADCTEAVQVSIVDSEGVAVAIPPGSQITGRCGAVTLGATDSATYTFTWAPDPTLPSGSYTVTLALGDQKPVQMDLEIRTVDGGC